MQFREWLITEWGKYLTYTGSACEHCKGHLIAVYVSENVRHIYHIGQYWLCNCKKSRVWTNSIRNEKRFLDYLLKKEDHYTNGFCNDLFCGHCYSPIQALKNGVDQIYGDVRADLFGCKRCADNQNIQFLIGSFLKEGKEVEIEDWYRRPQHVQELLYVMGYPTNQVEQLLKSICEPEKLAKFASDKYSGYLDKNQFALTRTWIPKSKPR